MRRNKGFTLIELMIVVAIIAIIAAIAIPSLLRSRLAANETSAAGALRNIHATESAFRQNDADGNGLPDFWTLDWSGFFRIADGGGAGSKFTDVALAKADGAPGAATAAPRPFLTAAVSVGAAAEKSGYFYRAMTTDNTAPAALAYQLDGGDADALAWENSAKYGFTAYPQAYNSSGVNVFLTTEDGVVWARDLGTVGPGGAAPAGAAVMANAPGGQVTWPGAPGSSDLSAIAGAPWRVIQ
ncbi:MAG: DUF2950 family protein [Planctomycetes bacterium]|nr:DUF2950 family protein [Planctomycetota bacterium]